jgi:hypothetical protein
MHVTGGPMLIKSPPLQAQFIFKGVQQVHSFPFAIVAISIGAEDQAMRNFIAEFEIPLRDIRGQTIEVIEQYSLDMARRLFDQAAILPALRNQPPT